MYLAACPTFRKDLWGQHCVFLPGSLGLAHCLVPTCVSWGSYDQPGMQGDMSGRGSRRTGCWDGRSKTKLWTPLIGRGEKSTYPEPHSSCPCARAKKKTRQKKATKPLWVAVYLLTTKGVQLLNWEKRCEKPWNQVVSIPLQLQKSRQFHTRTWYMALTCGHNYMWRHLHV